MAEVYLVQMRQIPHCYSNTFLEVGWDKKSWQAKTKKGGGATLYHDNSSPEGANNIIFPVKVLNFNLIS